MLTSNPQYLKDLVQSCLLKHTNTPDNLVLIKQDVHYVFVYGTLKIGYHNNDLLQYADYIGNGITTDNSYILGDTGAYPAAIHKTITTQELRNDIQWGNIRGEVYAVQAEDINYLDRLEGNGYYYKRYLRPIKVLDNRKIKSIIKCWVYELLHIQDSEGMSLISPKIENNNYVYSYIRKNLEDTKRHYRKNLRK